MRRCHSCQVGEIVPTRAKGRIYFCVEIPEEIEIPTCNQCGAEWLNEKIAEEIQESIDAKATNTR
jgi:hypothetical protein